jgi:hypothetical protein
MHETLRLSTRRRNRPKVSALGRVRLAAVRHATRFSRRESAVFAIERRHVRGWVAGARDRTARRDRLDLGELLWGQRLRSERFLKLLDRAHAERRHELRLFAQHPTDRELTRRDTPTRREILETGDELGVRFAIQSAKPRQVCARVTGADRAGREQPARQHAVQRRADAELREHRKDRVLWIATRDRVLDLEIGDRVDLRRAPDCLGPTSDSPIDRT